jgi:hypothetical protein
VKKFLGKESEKMKLGIVGAGADKFTEIGKTRCKKKIEDIILRSKPDVVISGGSPVGGVDIWAEEIAKTLGVETCIYKPKINQWDPKGGYGFRARNLDIAKNSDVVVVLVVDSYPPDYKGKKFDTCHHCINNPFIDEWHVKSGGCWTGGRATQFVDDNYRQSKQVEWIVIKNGDE